MKKFAKTLMPLDFVGIGVTRSGTTWTWNQLIKHPEICSLPKGTSLFAPGNTTRQWRRRFNVPRCYLKCGNLLQGDFTPRYLHMPNSLRLIAENSPEAKLLVILRNPIDRIFTQYKTRQWLNWGQVKEDFMDFFNQRRNQRCHLGWPERCWAESSKYARWLRPWLTKFGDQVHVGLYDDLVKDSLAFIQAIYKHLGVDHTFVPPGYEERERKAYNVYYEKNPCFMQNDHRKEVLRYYRRSILETQELIGQDLSAWLVF
jgi:hypothetical protein